jgi:hypothetical protein
MDTPNSEWNRADDATMDAADAAIAQVVAELAIDRGMIAPDIIILLIGSAVELAFEALKRGLPLMEDTEDVKAIIQDTVDATFEAKLKRYKATLS